MRLLTLTPSRWSRHLMVNLDAMTISSRFLRDFIQAPRMRSDSPRVYALAVSMKLPPFSQKASRNSNDCASFSPELSVSFQAVPSCIAPKQRGETRTELREDRRR